MKYIIRKKFILYGCKMLSMDIIINKIRKLFKLLNEMGYNIIYTEVVSGYIILSKNNKLYESNIKKLLNKMK